MSSKLVDSSHSTIRMIFSISLLSDYVIIEGKKCDWSDDLKALMTFFGCPEKDPHERLGIKEIDNRVIKLCDF